MSRDLSETELDVLENLIDANGLQAVLEALSTICGRKAQHIAEHWQDTRLAKYWMILEGRIAIVSTAAEGL